MTRCVVHLHREMCVCCNGFAASLDRRFYRSDWQMVDAMKQVAKMDVELTVEERNLLSVAYKNTIGARRASWRIISSIEQKEDSKGNQHHVARIREYRAKVELELSNICTDVLTILDRHLVPASTSGATFMPSGRMQSAARLGAGGPFIGTGVYHGSRVSGALIASRERRRSAMLRASGPLTAINWAPISRSGSDAFQAGTRPSVGRMP